MQMKKVLKTLKSKLILIIDFCIKYRYVIAIIAFAIMVACKINFSSVDCWGGYIYGADQESETLIGEARGIRSDEWAVQTPYVMSQTSNDSYDIYNEKIGEGANMILRRSTCI